MSKDETLPPEMLPECPGAEVYVQCPSCSTHWAVDQYARCPKCGRGIDEPLQ